MDLNKWNEIIKEGDLESKNQLYNKFLELNKYMINLLFDDLSCAPDFVVSERINSYISQVKKPLLKGLNNSKNEDELFYLSLILFYQWPNESIKYLIKFAKGDNNDKSGFAITKLVEIGYEGVIDIINDKVKLINFEDVDYCLNILDGIKKMKMELPNKFKATKIDQLPRMIQLVLREDFKIV